jgi:acyl-ACP thioesterase
MRYVITLPESNFFYGFIENNKEIESKEVIIVTGVGGMPNYIFISVYDTIKKSDIDNFMHLNNSIYFRHIHTGWINCQYNTKRITIQFELD